MDDAQCLHCGEQLHQLGKTEWLHCHACAHAYLPQDLLREQERRQQSAQHNEIMQCLKEDQRRGDKGGGSKSSRVKDDKLSGRSLRQATWVESDGGILMGSRKTEPKTEFLAVRGLPEDLPSEVILEAVEAEIFGGDANT